MSASRSDNLELEGIRGIACLLVALSHAFFLTHLDPTVHLPPWLRTIEAGHTGVLIFFVLSGYLIGWTNSGAYSAENSHAYLWRRFVRLAPIYYVAMVLTTAVVIVRGDHGQVRAIAAALLGLQNFNDYFGLHLPLPMSNGPLWSLNYELLYYVLFLLLWRFQPRLFWVFVPAAIASLLGWFTPQWIPLFLASYACGWLFWAGGWWLARLPEISADTRQAPVASWLLLVFAGHQLSGVTRILNVLGMHSNDAGMITLGDLGVLPAILLTLAAVTRRRLPAASLLSVLAWLICIVPLAGMLWKGRLWTEPSWITGGIAVLLAALALSANSLRWLKQFAGLGRISYAFYVVHFPLLFVVQRLPLPSGSVPAYLLRVSVWAIAALGLAWMLEQRFQPWVKARLPRPNFA